MNFTLVSTVFNEAKRLDQTVDDLTKQNLQPNEIIITDAGSNDGTYERLLEWKKNSSIPITILQKLRCNVAEGRNLAINAAKYDIIASMDFGCRYHPDWLKSLIPPFDNPDVKVVGGGFSVIEEELQTNAAKAAFILGNGYKINTNPDSFIPSSRSIAYRKEVFNDVGGYCEWLTLAADDLVFGLVVRKKQYKIYVVDKPYAFWMRHETAKGYVKEAYRYGLGDGEAKVNYTKFRTTFLKKLGRFGLYACILCELVVFAFFHIWLIVPVILMPFLALSFSHYRSYVRNWLRLRSAKYNFVVLLYALNLIGKINTGYIKGYIKGFYFPSEIQKVESEKLSKILQTGDDKL